ncbi:MAG: hypothetical protein AAF362_02370 [Pseudomonadota bacterium]
MTGLLGTSAPKEVRYDDHPGDGDNISLPTFLDEAAVAAFDAAAKGPELNNDLLQSSPTRDLRIQIQTTITLLEELDHKALLAKQGTISRLTGADIEARLVFELASSKVLKAFDQMRKVAANGRHVLYLLWDERETLVGEQERLEHLIGWARQLLKSPSQKDDFLVSRFERRLANVMALHTANVVTIQQISLGQQVLQTILDRHTDIETILLPLWQRNTLALAQYAGSRGQNEAAEAFERSQDALLQFLKQEQP